MLRDCAVADVLQAKQFTGRRIIEAKSPERAARKTSVRALRRVALKTNGCATSNGFLSADVIGRARLPVALDR